jgi:PelA/Pel-15E family pectate lyase
MKHPIPEILLPALLALRVLLAVSPALGQPTADEVRSAMKFATEFMMGEVSYKGGFLAHYSEDLSRQWGEVPARRTMVWVQEPGTVGVGRLFLDTYTLTGDPYYRRMLDRVCAALIAGQRPEGGWHYLIDFDPAGIEEWYREVGCKAWGWEEFYHWDDNSTFDDDVSAGAAEFLLDVYEATLDPVFKESVLKALDFILRSQYPMGGWPQRYPLRPGYSSYYTFNDGVMIGNIEVLWKAHRFFGDERYREAALRGMFFYQISQYREPQAGWSQAHDLDLVPAGARSYEPKGLSTGTTTSNIRDLETFYRMTGDRRFLRSIPAAIEWLEGSVLPKGHSEEGHTHAEFVELETNRPLYAHREGTCVEDGRYWVDCEPGNFPGHYGMQVKLDLETIRAEYRRYHEMTPEQARAEYEASLHTEPVLPRVTPEEVRIILESLDPRGAWVEDLSLPDHTDWKFKPRHEFRGISTRTYTANMTNLLAYLRQLETSEATDSEP